MSEILWRFWTFAKFKEHDSYPWRDQMMLSKWGKLVTALERWYVWTAVLGKILANPTWEDLMVHVLGSSPV